MSDRMRTDRRGVVIYLVSMIAIMIGLFISILHYHRSANRKQFISKREKVQAQFLARGAQQHFLLKMKYLAAQLYEASAYSVGRNPNYDFGGYLRRVEADKVWPCDDLGVGPLFFTGGPATQIFGVPHAPGDTQAPASALVLVVDRSKDRIFDWPSGGQTQEENKARMGFLLQHYLVDISSDYPAGSSVIRFDSTAPYASKASMGSNAAQDVSWQDPISGSYFMEDFQLLGQGGGGSRAGKKFEADSVTLTTEAQVRVDGQVSLVSAVGGWPRALSRVARDTNVALESKTGEAGWTALEFSQESDASYAARTGSQSVRRTELVTSSYLVRRPK